MMRSHDTATFFIGKPGVPDFPELIVRKACLFFGSCTTAKFILLLIGNKSVVFGFLFSGGLDLSSTAGELVDGIALNPLQLPGVAACLNTVA